MKADVRAFEFLEGDCENQVTHLNFITQSQSAEGSVR